MNEYIQESINGIKEGQEEFNDAVKKAAENSQDVKDGKSTVEEEMQEPENILYNEIAETSIRILSDKIVHESFDIIAKELSIESMQALTSILAIIMTRSAFEAILFYDELLKKELSKQFGEQVHHINLLKSDVMGHNGALKVFKAQLEEIKKQLRTSELKVE